MDQFDSPNLLQDHILSSSRNIPQRRRERLTLLVNSQSMETGVNIGQNIIVNELEMYRLVETLKDAVDEPCKRVQESIGKNEPRDTQGPYCIPAADSSDGNVWSCEVVLRGLVKTGTSGRTSYLNKLLCIRRKFVFLLPSPESQTMIQLLHVMRAMTPVDPVYILDTILMRPVFKDIIPVLHTAFSQDADIVHECGSTSCDEAASREAKEEDLVAWLIVLDKRAVSITNGRSDGVCSRSIYVSVPKAV
jgi:hypothetical protein